MNNGFIYLFCLCGWHIALIAIGWALRIRYESRGLAGLLPNLKIFSGIKNDVPRIFPPRGPVQ